MPLEMPSPKAFWLASLPGPIFVSVALWPPPDLGHGLMRYAVWWFGLSFLISFPMLLIASYRKGDHKEGVE